VEPSFEGACRTQEQERQSESRACDDPQSQSAPTGPARTVRSPSPRRPRSRQGTAKRTRNRSPGVHGRQALRMSRRTLSARASGRRNCGVGGSGRRFRRQSSRCRCALRRRPGSQARRCQTVRYRTDVSAAVRAVSRSSARFLAADPECESPPTSIAPRPGTPPRCDPSDKPFWRTCTRTRRARSTAPTSSDA